VVRAQPCPLNQTAFLIDGMRNYRKRMHIQPDTRTFETHRRPPELQMWLYRSECSPASSNPRPFAARGLRPRLSLHTNLFNTGQVIEVCSHDVLGVGSGSLALIPAAPRGWLLDGLRPGSAPLAGSG
jgi:hypothetical protein